ncbi:MAG: 4Fe-4S dicluster domain-containing protein [bacterium]
MADKPIKIDHRFREELGLVLEGDGVSYCYQCGACVGDCPSARFSENFNPRNIMLNVLYGMREEVIATTSPVWECSNCFTCFDRCPQDVKPIEVIIALKNLMARQGVKPQGIDRLVEGLLKTGRSALVTSATHRRREELGLPPLGEVDPAELQALVEDSDTPPPDKPANKSAAKPAAKKGQKNPPGKGGKGGKS